MVLLSVACSPSAGVNEEFGTKNETLVLKAMYPDPKYNFGEQKGWAIVFYRKSKLNPINLVLDMKTAQFVPVSPLEFELIDGDRRIPYKDIRFSSIEDKDYGSQIVFFYSVEADVFPKKGAKGVFTIDNENKDENVEIDLTDLPEIPVPVEETSAPTDTSEPKDTGEPKDTIEPVENP